MALLADAGWSLCLIKRNSGEGIANTFRLSTCYADYQEDIRAFWQPLFVFDDKKKTKIAQDLFDCYLFVYIRKNSFIWLILEQNDFRIFRFFTYLSPADHKRRLLFLKDDEIQELRNICSNPAYYQIKTKKLNFIPGSIKTIKRGLFKDRNIKITQIKNNVVEGSLLLFNTMTSIKLSIDDLFDVD